MAVSELSTRRRLLSCRRAAIPYAKEYPAPAAISPRCPYRRSRKARGEAQLATQGKILLDCPVSGTGAQAARKDLVVFASGDEAAFARCREVLAGTSRAQKYVGAFGNGNRMKFIANHLVTIHNLATAEALVLGDLISASRRQFTLDEFGSNSY